MHRYRVPRRLGLGGMPRWAVAASIAIVLVFAALGSQSYFGRVNLHTDAMNGCLRGTLDRADNARGWRSAQAARQAAAFADPGGRTFYTDLLAATRYGQIAASLESRTRPTRKGRLAYCRRAYPAPSPLPWKA